MKPWRDLSEIPMPHRIASLPKDERGYPIPVTVALDANGKPDFRVVGMEATQRCFDLRLCAICGEPLGKHVAFVGGPRSVIAHLFHDLWMHAECAKYALQVCPFLAAPKFAYARAEPQLEGMQVQVLESASTDRPVVFGMGVTDKGARQVRNGNDLVIQAGPFHTVQWWARGQEVAPAEAAELAKAGQVSS